MNVTVKNENVPEAERQNQVIKERARAITKLYCIKAYLEKYGLIYYVVYWLNNVPKTGQDISPKDLIFGEQRLDYNNICKLPFGSYMQVHDDLVVTNTMESRTTGAIILGSTRKIEDWRNCCQAKWSGLPVPWDVIERLDDLTFDKSNYEEDLYENMNQEIEDNSNIVIMEEEEQQVPLDIENEEGQRIEIEDHQIE